MDRKVEGPRTEFLGPANILWMQVLAKETKPRASPDSALSHVLTHSVLAFTL